MTDYITFDSTEPTSSDRFDAKTNIGKLLAALPHETGFEHVADVPTSNGTADAVRVPEIVNIDTGESWSDVLLFQRVLMATLTGKTNPVLGRLELGAARPGKSQPYVLDAPTEADIAKALEVLAQHANTKPEPRPATGGPSQIEEPFVAHADTADIEAHQAGRWS